MNISTKRTIRAATAVAGLGLALALVAPTATFARGGGAGKQVAGDCSAHATSELKVKRDDGRLEVEFEVDQNKNGVTWDVRLKNDGVSFWHGPKVTHAPSGSFSVNRMSTDGAGSDTISARATNRNSGEVCTAHLTI